VVAPYTPGGPPTWSPPGPWGSQGGAVANPQETDLQGLSKVWIAALISIVGSALGVAVPLALSSTGYFRIALPSSGSAVSYGLGALYLVLGVAVAGLAISIVSFWFYRDGFLSFRRVDIRFASSPTWALLVIIGLVMVCLGLVALLAGLAQVLSCTGVSTTIPPSCVNVGALLGGAALLLVGAIVLLIGYIGTLVAIWRLGDRFGSSLFKVGAVLLIFPFLSIVGEILILVAASNARSLVQQRPGYAMAPSVQYPPPPPQF
jgi:hypothetical protein